MPLALVPLYGVLGKPVSTLMLWNRLRGEPVRRERVAFEDIAPPLAQAVIMTEDGKYCSHGGVDWEAIREVMSSDADRRRGASTITMQTAKNLFLWQSRSYIRKALEIPLALYMDLVWSKRWQMEIYLNIAQWGEGIYGAEAAAQHHFNRPASKLSYRQAALLAASLSNPVEFNAGKPGPRTRRIAGIIEKRARQSGAYIKCLEE